jgi:hypothetical protein
VFIINGLTDKTTLGSKPKNVILRQVSWGATDGLFLGGRTAQNQSLDYPNCMAENHHAPEKPGHSDEIIGT